MNVIVAYCLVPSYFGLLKPPFAGAPLPFTAPILAFLLLLLFPSSDLRLPAGLGTDWVKNEPYFLLITSASSKPRFSVEHVHSSREIYHGGH